jgi:hypothetical protein
MKDEIKKFATISSIEVNDTSVNLVMDTVPSCSGKMYYYVTCTGTTGFINSKSVAFNDLELATKVYNLCLFAINPNRKED